MTSAKLVTSPAEGHGLTQKITDQHFAMAVKGEPVPLLPAVVMLKQVAFDQKETAQGIHRSVRYEVVKLEPITDSNDASELQFMVEATGLADNDRCYTIPTTGRVNATLVDRAHRIHRIRNGVLAYCKGADLVVIEGPSLGSNTGHVWDRGGLWWAVVSRLVANNIPVAVVSPKGRAKYIAGHGNASKDTVMLAAAQRFRLTHTIANNNEADAVGLAAMGLDHLGVPIAVMPDHNRAALAAVTWPELVSE